MTYRLDIVCDHTRNLPDSEMPPRIVTTIVHNPRPADQPGRRHVGWLEWRELESDYPAAMQTYYGEAQRLGRRPSEYAPGDLVPGMGYAQRWRFWCADCDDTLPARHARVMALLEALRQAGLTSITLTALAARLA